MCCASKRQLKEINRNLLKDTIGNELDSEIHILANGTASGLILAWKSSLFIVIQSQSLSCCASVNLKLHMDGSVFRDTEVYR